MEHILIPSSIRKYLEESNWIALATCDAQGRPNVANKFFIKCEQDTVFLADYAKGTTCENIKRHPIAAFPIIDPENLIDYQLSGVAKVLDRSDLHHELIEQLKNRELDFSTQRVIAGIHRGKAHSTFEFPDISEAAIIRIRVNDIVSRGPRIRVKNI
ncbi:MAG: pyridoxamine 5'-phosphate oxidase family protein [Candidatus Omnitrophota bacterium]